MPVMNVVVTVKDRPRLTKQTLRTLRATIGNQNGSYRPFRYGDIETNVVVVDDGSGPEMQEFYDPFSEGREWPQGFYLLRYEGPKSGYVGALKNAGARYLEEKVGKPDWVYFSDNDVYFCQGWPGWMKVMVKFVKSFYGHTKFAFGGQAHPFHKPVFVALPFNGYNCMAGTSFMVTQEVWEEFGPFVEHAPGVWQSEDWEFTERLRKSREPKDIVAIAPNGDNAVVLDCGLTATNGRKAPGYEEKLVRLKKWQECGLEVYYE